MKQILFIVLTASLFCACRSNLKPDNVIHQTDIVQNGYRPQGPGKQPLAVMDTTVYMKPTWGQAINFARARGDHGVMGWLAGLCLVVFAGGFYGRASDAKWFPNINDIALAILLLVFLAGFIGAGWGQAMRIKWDNKIGISKQRYDQAMRESGSTRPIWDSLKAGCHIIGGPYNRFDE